MEQSSGAAEAPVKNLAERLLQSTAAGQPANMALMHLLMAARDPMSTHCSNTCTGFAVERLKETVK